MLTLDTRWRQWRRRLRPITTKVPGGHLVTEGATYARLVLPVIPRPETRFVVFAQGRSGSSLLVDLLNSHPQIVCDDEILTYPRRWPARYAAACSVGHRATAWGFKVKVYQLLDAQQMEDPGALLRQLHGEGWKVIHLHRRNVLHQALSSMVAAARGGLYHHRVEGAPPPAVEIDPLELLRRTAERERFVTEEAKALEGVPHLALVYEDDLLEPESHQETAIRVFRHLGLPPSPVETVLAKLALSPLEGIANADEVRQVVGASDYGPLLDER